jgi:RNA polymerase sigma factor (sigma-70 family)
MSEKLVLYNYYEDKFEELCKIMGSRFVNPTDGEDVVQEAFCRAIKYWGSYNPNYEIGQWFHRILTNCLFKAKNDERMSGMSNTSDKEKDLINVEFLDVIMEFSDVGQVNKMIQGKVGSQKEILELYYLKHYKPSEISQILNLNCGVIRTTVWRFKEEFK